MSAGPEKFSVRWRKSRDAGVSRYELQYQTKPENGGSWPSAWTAISETIAAEAGVTTYSVRTRRAGLGPSLPLPGAGRERGGSGPLVGGVLAAGGSAAAGGDDAHGARGRGGRDRNWTYLKREQGVGWSRLWASIPGSGVNTTSHTFSGLTEGQSYTFPVKALRRPPRRQAQRPRVRRRRWGSIPRRTGPRRGLRHAAGGEGHAHRGWERHAELERRPRYQQLGRGLGERDAATRRRT